MHACKDQCKELAKNNKIKSSMDSPFKTYREMKNNEEVRVDWV